MATVRGPMLGDSLWMDPDSGDVIVLVPGDEPGMLRPAAEDDALAALILSRQPFEEGCEFDFRGDRHANFQIPEPPRLDLL